MQQMNAFVYTLILYTGGDVSSNALYLPSHTTLLLILFSKFIFAGKIVREKVYRSIAFTSHILFYHHLNRHYMDSVGYS